MQQRIIWSAAREDPNTCVLNVAYIYASTKRAIASTDSKSKPKKITLDALFLDICSERRIYNIMNTSRVNLNDICIYVCDFVCDKHTFEILYFLCTL